MPYDVNELRSRFPALTGDQVFLDAPAGTQVPQTVIDAVSAAMVDAVSNVGGEFAASHRSGDVVADARQAAADLVGGSPDEVVFGANMTSITLAFSRALARTWSPGDRIVVTSLDHDANVTPWVLAARDAGVEVDVCDIIESDVTLDLGHLASLMTPKTRLVAVTGCSNAFGSLVDLAAVSAVAHDVGAHVYADAVHLAPHEFIDVSDFGVDYLVCSAYKFFGPHVGVLWGRAELLADVQAYKVRPAPSDPPGRFETGTPSFPLFAGLTAAVDHIASIADGPDRRSRLERSFREIRRHEVALGERFLSGVGQNVRVWGRPDMTRRVCTFSFEVEGMAAGEVAAALGERNIACWSGHYYAVEPMERLGLLESGGLVRVGFTSITTDDEVDLLLAALADL